MIDRKPDLETESLRVWDVKDDEDKELDTEEGPSIPYGDGEELKLLGFTYANDENGKLFLAYKFKHETKTVIYYFGSDEDNSSKKTFLDGILKHMPEYTPVNMRDGMFRKYKEESKNESNTTRSNGKKVC